MLPLKRGSWLAAGTTERYFRLVVEPVDQPDLRRLNLRVQVNRSLCGMHVPIIKPHEVNGVIDGLYEAVLILEAHAPMLVQSGLDAGANLQRIGTLVRNQRLIVEQLGAVEAAL